jgi:hypothetical protein
LLIEPLDTFADRVVAKEVQGIARIAAGTAAEMMRRPLSAR